MNTPPELTVPPTYKDRSVALKVFGAFTIFFGVVTTLWLGISAVGIAMSPHQQVNTMQVAATMGCIYGIPAVALIVLGIGSILLRRWARALIAIGAWLTAAMGVIMLVAVIFIIPEMHQTVQQATAQNGQKVPESFFLVMIAIMIGFLSVIFLIIPLVWGLFYARKDVKLTCEAHDPKVRWTDAAPLPALAAALWNGWMGICLLFFPMMYGGIVPFFGALLHGWVGTAESIVLAAIYLYTAWAVYKLRPTGWWLALALPFAYGVSIWLTFTRHSMMEIYEGMHYSEAQLAQMSWMNGWMAWSCLAFFIPTIIYLLCIRKYFFAKAAA